MLRANLLEKKKTLMLVNTEGRRRVGQRMRCFNGITWSILQD